MLPLQEAKVLHKRLTHILGRHHKQTLIHISRCLAHVINLATQALLAAHSPAKHYDPTKPTEHEPDVDRYLHDEIGLVRAIVVKVSSFCQTFVSLIANFGSEGLFLSEA